MCKDSRESVGHLLLHCPMAHDLWSLVFFVFRNQDALGYHVKGVKNNLKSLIEKGWMEGIGILLCEQQFLLHHAGNLEGAE